MKNVAKTQPPKSTHALDANQLRYVVGGFGTTKPPRAHDNTNDPQQPASDQNRP